MWRAIGDRLINWNSLSIRLCGQYYEKRLNVRNYRRCRKAFPVVLYIKGLCKEETLCYTNHTSKSQTESDPDR